MVVIDELFSRTDAVLGWALIAFRLWAVGDCLVRKAPAFPAVDKLTKPAWLTILIVCSLFGLLISYPAGPIALITTVVAAIYLADVRPAVREVSGGR